MMWKAAPREAAILLCGPVVFIACVIPWHVMIVRNYLLIAPFLAFLCARGVGALLEALTVRPRVQFAAAALFAVMIVANAAWLFHAANTIRHRHQADLTADIIGHLHQHPRTRYFLSSQLAHAVAMRMGGLQLTNVTGSPDDAERYLFSTGDLFFRDLLNLNAKLSCNRPGQYAIVSGPLEVNFDYYPNWLGDPRVVELSMQSARDMQIAPTR